MCKPLYLHNKEVYIWQKNTALYFGPAPSCSYVLSLLLYLIHIESQILVNVLWGLKILHLIVDRRTKRWTENPNASPSLLESGDIKSN